VKGAVLGSQAAVASRIKLLITGGLASHVIHIQAIQRTGLGNQVTTTGSE